jgi:hypothetical protein
VATAEQREEFAKRYWETINPYADPAHRAHLLEGLRKAGSQWRIVWTANDRFDHNAPPVPRAALGHGPTSSHAGDRSVDPQSAEVVVLLGQLYLEQQTTTGRSIRSAVCQ